MNLLKTFADILPHLLPQFRGESTAFLPNHGQGYVCRTNSDQLCFGTTGQIQCSLYDRHNRSVDVEIY